MLGMYGVVLDFAKIYLGTFSAHTLFLFNSGYRRVYEYMSHKIFVVGICFWKFLEGFSD